MSQIGSYPTRTFKESQKFLVLDPETQSASLVLGRDLVEYITPQSTYVFAEQSRAVAQNEDYQIGALIQTAGDLTAGDNFAGTFLVVPGGDGDFPMANGNDLLIIKGDILLREQLASNTPTKGSDLIAHTGTSDTVTQALDKRAVAVDSIADLLALPEGQRKEGLRYLVKEYHAGSAVGGGEFYWDAASAAADNGGTVFAVSGVSTGRFVRRFDGAVNVTWFGARGDGVTDDSQSVRDAIAHLFATDGNTLFFPDGVFYFATPVTITFPAQLYNRGLRLIGTSMPGFVSARPGGSRITGSNGIEALFIFTKTTPTSAGGYSFECENIDFNGNNRSVGSAILNKAGGAPSRPFNVASCNFVGFDKAIYSDISATGLTTGICQVNIINSSLNRNNHAVYAKGQSAIMDLRFHGNVCEQNTLGGIVSEVGAFSGGVSIANNMLEGQPNAIDIQCGKAVVEISGNYFEHNTDKIVSVIHSSGGSKTTLWNNYYQYCEGSDAVFVRGELRILDNLKVAGINLRANGTDASSINNEGVYQPFTRNSASTSGSVFIPSSADIGVIGDPAGYDGAYIKYRYDGAATTPLGELGCANVTINQLTAKPLTEHVFSSGDLLVANVLIKTTDRYRGNRSIAMYLYDASGVFVGNTVGGDLARSAGEWRVASLCYKIPSGYTAQAFQVGFRVGGAPEDTSTFTIASPYIYKIPAFDTTDGTVHLGMPSLAPLFQRVVYTGRTLAAGARNEDAFTVSGAAPGDLVEAVWMAGSGGVEMYGYVSAADTVTVISHNQSGAAVSISQTYMHIKVNKAL